MAIYVARQPIFNQEKKIFGYELLFRDSIRNVFSGIDGNTATSKVLSNSFFNIGIEKLIGKGVAFINFTKEHLINQLPKQFPSDQLVIEILEDVEAEDEVVKACIEMSKQGYRIALDDFFYNKGLDPLIAIADIIKFDFRATSPGRIIELVEHLSRYDLKFLAEKVETNEEFKTGLELGFDFFQGYFLSKPEIVGGKDVSPAQYELLNIMAQAKQKSFAFSKVEKIIEEDFSISHSLISYINSDCYKSAGEISSVKQTIALLGENWIRSFLSIIVMTGLAPDKPDELICCSAFRAKFGELMAECMDSPPDPGELFTLGLFSSIDAILDNSMENIMSKLPLSENIKAALVDGDGELKKYLDLVKSYECGDWNEFSETRKNIQMNDETLPEYFIEAISWADAITSL